MTPDEFIHQLAELELPNTFNPYREKCWVEDIDDAPVHRRQMLLSILEKAVERGVEDIWVGRDLGYRGGRRTGLAFTDDPHIAAHAARFGVIGKRVTKGEPFAEATATAIWGVINQIEAPIFLWNVFPLHPHHYGYFRSNRPHNKVEEAVGGKILIELINMLKPKRVISVGVLPKKLEKRINTQSEVKLDAVLKVRHPSYGGQTLFRDGMKELYNLPDIFMGQVLPK